ncbi:MAG: phosphotransferase family protein [Anaerolineales bacterium]|nr:phosphotransferase family protein [Anaerolineales bacterium]
MTNVSANSTRQQKIDDAVKTAFGNAAWTYEEQLTGGLSTANLHKITVNGNTYVVRIGEPNRAYHQLDREYTAMALAARHQIAPAIYYADRQTGVLMMDFIAGQSLASFHFGDPQQLERFAQFIHKLHQLPAFPEDTPFSEKLDGLLALCVSDVQANDLVQQGMTLKSDLARLLADEEDKRPSHADINPTNLLFDGTRLWLIDWASATQQSFYFDLASASLFFFYQNDAINDAFLRAYLKRPSTPVETAKYFLMRLFVSIYYGLIFLYLSTQNKPQLLSQAEVDTLPEHSHFMQLVGDGKENVATPRSQQKLGFIYLKTALASAQTSRFIQAVTALHN